MGHTDGENQERHQNRHRVNAQPQHRQQAEQPDHRQQRHQQRHHGQAQGTRVDPQQHTGNQKGHDEETDDRHQAIDHIAHQLGKADDTDLYQVIAVLGANILQPLGDFDIAHSLARLGVDILQVGAHHRRLQVVGHQPPDLAGTGSIAAHLRKVVRGTGEARRHHHITEKAFFGDFDVTYVGGKQGRYACAADTRNEEHIVGDLAQRIEKLGIVDVAFALPLHTDQETVGPGEVLAEIEEVDHILVTHRDLFIEARVQLGLGRTVAKPQGQQHEYRQQQLALGHEHICTALDLALYPGFTLLHDLPHPCPVRQRCHRYLGKHRAHRPPALDRRRAQWLTSGCPTPLDGWP
ncbi:hypothetical protein D3C85_1107300 [compost metagenome]